MVENHAEPTPKNTILYIWAEFCVKATLGACNQQERQV